MTVVSYAIGLPRPAPSRGGDCHARDLRLDRNVHDQHRFVTTSDCQISNGMLRLTVGAAGAVPTLTVEAWRGRVTIDDFYEDTYVDLYGGTVATPAWLPMGVLTIDSSSVSALLTDVRIAHINDESVALRLIAPLMADAWVTLRRGERQARIQHGSTRPPLLDIDRRLSWIDTPSPVGSQVVARVEEASPATQHMRRYLGSLNPVTVDAGAFSLVVSSVTTADFGAGVAGYALGDRSLDMHRQLRDASRPSLVVV